MLKTIYLVFNCGVGYSSVYLNRYLLRLKFIAVLGRRHPN